PAASGGAFDQSYQCNIRRPVVAASASEPTLFDSLALVATQPSRSKLRGIGPTANEGWSPMSSSATGVGGDTDAYPIFTSARISRGGSGRGRWSLPCHLFFPRGRA